MQTDKSVAEPRLLQLSIHRLLHLLIIYVLNLFIKASFSYEA